MLLYFCSEVDISVYPHDKNYITSIYYATLPVCLRRNLEEPTNSGKCVVQSPLISICHGSHLSFYSTTLEEECILPKVFYPVHGESCSPVITVPRQNFFSCWQCQAIAPSPYLWKPNSIKRLFWIIYKKEKEKVGKNIAKQGFMEYPW